MGLGLLACLPLKTQHHENPVFRGRFFLSSEGALCGCIGAIWIKQELYRAAHGIPRVMQGPDKVR